MNLAIDDGYSEKDEEKDSEDFHKLLGEAWVKKFLGLE